MEKLMLGMNGFSDIFETINGLVDKVGDSATVDLSNYYTKSEVDTNISEVDDKITTLRLLDGTLTENTTNNAITNLSPNTNVKVNDKVITRSGAVYVITEVNDTTYSVGTRFAYISSAVDVDLTEINNKIGDLTSLDTTAQDNLVNAINEINSKITSSSSNSSLVTISDPYFRFTTNMPGFTEFGEYVYPLAYEDETKIPNVLNVFMTKTIVTGQTEEETPTDIELDVEVNVLFDTVIDTTNKKVYVFVDSNSNLSKLQYMI